MFGCIQFIYFLFVFGFFGDQLLDVGIVWCGFIDLVVDIVVWIGDDWLFEQVVEGYLWIVVVNMVNVVKKIFV